jgi:hypothetical protein
LFYSLQKKNIGLPPVIVYLFSPLVDYVGLRFHHFTPFNVSEFYFTPSLSMPHHHLHEGKKHYKGVIPKKKLQWGNRKKKIAEG